MDRIYKKIKTEKWDIYWKNDIILGCDNVYIFKNRKSGNICIVFMYSAITNRQTYYINYNNNTI